MFSEGEARRRGLPFRRRRRPPAPPALITDNFLHRATAERSRLLHTVRLTASHDGGRAGRRAEISGRPVARETRGGRDGAPRGGDSPIRKSQVCEYYGNLSRIILDYFTY